VIALAVVFTPLFLFMSGKNVTYKAGREFAAFVDGNFTLDPVKFDAAPEVTSDPNMPPMEERFMRPMEER
jgi:hypothetical protein